MNFNQISNVIVASFNNGDGLMESSSDWLELEPMRCPVYGCGVVAVDQNIFVIGG